MVNHQLKINHEIKKKTKSRDKERHRETNETDFSKKSHSSKLPRHKTDTKLDARGKYEKKSDKIESILVTYTLESDDDDFTLSNVQGNIEPTWLNHALFDSSSDEEMVYMSSDESDYENWIADNKVDESFRSILDNHHADQHVVDNISETGYFLIDCSINFCFCDF